MIPKILFHPVFQNDLIMELPSEPEVGSDTPADTQVF
jgi:hypothetical protein